LRRVRCSGAGTGSRRRDDDHTRASRPHHLIRGCVLHLSSVRARHQAGRSGIAGRQCVRAASRQLTNSGARSAPSTISWRTGRPSRSRSWPPAPAQPVALPRRTRGQDSPARRAPALENLHGRSYPTVWTRSSYTRANSSEAFAARRLLATCRGSTTMRRAACSCGSPFLRLFDDLGCVGCGQQCCRGCAVVIESAAYCVQCADALAVSVELFDPDPAPSSADRRR
jgi:hypothetical protein